MFCCSPVHNEHCLSIRCFVKSGYKMSRDSKNFAKQSSISTVFRKDKQAGCDSFLVGVYQLCTD